MRNTIIAFFITILSTLPYATIAQQPDSVKIFVDSALNIMKSHSMYSDKVNWKEVKLKVKDLAAHAKNYAEAGDAVKYAFSALGDKHGWLVLDDKDYRNPDFKPDTGRLSANIKAAASKGPKVYAGKVERYAYVSIPFFGKQDTVSMNAFAQRIQDSLCNNLSKDSKGIILDLRLNAGGNIYPMLVGISNVYGSQYEKGKSFVGDWEIKDHQFKLSETFYARLKTNCGDYTHLPVAVLIGPVTGSSGEFLAIGFSTRPKTILIGERTAGFTTANMGYLLPGKNNGIVLSESMAIDRNGITYPDGINPQLEIRGDDFFNRENDPKIQAALAWLKKQ